MPDRQNDLIRFYNALDRLERKTGTRCLATCNGRMTWPFRGVYFFMENGEKRSDTGDASRIVRVGTHALKSGSKTTLWKRLSQHKGTEKTGGGNHRGSIFRLIVGTALATKMEQEFPTWGKGNTAKGDIRINELPLELHVSKAIRDMPFLWLSIDDEAEPDSLRGYIERNSIALLSNWRKTPLDAASSNWIGHKCNRERVKKSGLWNQNHVNEDYDPAFLNTLEKLVDEVDTTL